MTGRRIFRKARGLITVISLFCKFVPLFILHFFYELSSIFSGKIALLLRYLYVSRASEKVGDALYIGRFVVLKNLSNLQVGKNVSIHDYCYLDCVGGVAIGDNVAIAHNCSIVSFEHGWSDKSLPIKYNSIVCSTVTIRDDVWIGAGVRILAGSYIEERVIVAAGSVVKGHLQSGYIYAGVPAKKVKVL